MTNQEKLDEMYELVRENNELLSSLLKREKISNFFKILYWFVVLGGLFGAYYFVQPYIQVLTSNFTAVQQALNSLGGVTNTIPEINILKNAFDAINNFKK
jgi:hypothetical protein